MLIEFAGLFFIFIAGIVLGWAHGYARGARSEFNRLYAIRRAEDAENADSPTPPGAVDHIVDREKAYFIRVS
jgi:hypothetical protein